MMTEDKLDRLNEVEGERDEDGDEGKKQKMSEQ